MFRVTANIGSKEQDMASLKEDILFLYEILDRDVGGLLENINSSIYDYKSALAAKNTFNKNWFCDKLLSVDSKIKIAILLKKLCQRYRVQSDVWDMICGGSSALLEQIDILQNKDKFRKSFEG